MVNYIDYSTQWMEEDLFLPFLTKRLSFKHEQELRAFTIIYDNDLSEHEVPENFKLSLPTVGKAIKRVTGQPRILVKGRNIRIDLDTLIEKIHVAPLAEQYFKDAVKSLILKYGLPADLLEISQLYTLR